MIRTAFALPRAEWKTIGLVALCHGSSRFYMALLPLLLVQMQDRFGLSWDDRTRLMMVYSIVALAALLLAGILVDRIGAKPLLLGGLVLQAAPFVLIPLFPNYWWLMVSAVSAGIAKAVFLPACYTILAARVDRARLGLAFGIHTSALYICSEVATPTIPAVASMFDWTVTASVVGLLGLLFAAVATFQRDVLDDSAARARWKNGTEKPLQSPSSTRRTLTSGPVLLFVLAFMLLELFHLAESVAFVASREIWNFLESVLFGAGVTLWIWALKLVPVAGGLLADRVDDRIRVVSICLVSYAVLLGVASLNVLPVYVAMWLGLGKALVILAGPAIDLLLLRVCPPGRIGTVFAFVATARPFGTLPGFLFPGAITESGMIEPTVWSSALILLLCVAAIYAAKPPAR